MSILYACNTFSFRELPLLLDFASTISPESLSSVQSLQFDYLVYRELWYMWPYLQPWSQRREWMDTYRILSDMADLREIRVKANMLANGFDESEYAKHMMKHLMAGTKARLLLESM